MDFNLSREHEMLRGVTRQFAKNELFPRDEFAQSEDEWPSDSQGI